jgi:hypothetical protein
MPNANRLLEFIVDTNAPCEFEQCTTCGGWGHFQIKLRQAFPRQSELIAELENISGKCVVQIGTGKNSVMPHLLTALPENDRQTLIANWVSRTSADPRLALGVLLWTQYGSSLDVDLRNKLLVASEPQLVIRRAIRADLRESLRKEAQEGMSWLMIALLDYRLVLPPGITLPTRLLQKIENDLLEEKLKAEQLAEEKRLEEQAQREEARLREQAHKEHLERIAALPFSEHVPRILSNHHMNPEDWYGCSRLDLESLDAKTVQKLIDLCVRGDAFSKLCDRRHQLRLEAMDKLRVKHKQLTPEQLLEILIQASSIPIEHYPVELTECATPEWIESIDLQDRKQFLAIMRQTKLRVWAKVLNRCSVAICAN